MRRHVGKGFEASAIKPSPTPFAELEQDRADGPPLLGQRVFNFWRNYGVDSSRYEAVFRELTQLRREKASCASRALPLKCVEAGGAIAKQVEEYNALPSTVD